MDILHSTLKVLDYERYKVYLTIALPFILLIMYSVGCTPTTFDPVDGSPVIRKELDRSIAATQFNLQQRMDAIQAEMTHLASEYQEAYLDLEKQEQRNIELLNQISALGSNLPTPYGGLLSTMITLAGVGFGIGGVVDSKRKNIIISQLKEA